MRILSIQSSVAYGYVGNAAATFPLQRLGHEVWPVNTAYLSNHTGYRTWRGQASDPAVVADVIDGIADLGVLGTADAVLTGHLGSAGMARVIIDTVARVRSLNSSALYCCDPVIGDVGRGVFVATGIPELIRDSLVPLADVLTPNAFELAFLAGAADCALVGASDPEIGDAAGKLTSEQEILAAVDRVRGSGPGTVLVTSVRHSGIGENEVAMIAVDGGGAYQVRHPRVPVVLGGAGDVTSALFMAHLADAGIVSALSRTASSLFAIMTASAQADRKELVLVQAQAAIAEPICEFPVVRLG